MKIVLLQDVKALGKKGEIKNVADGYALNFILPKKIGIIATPEAIQKVELEKAEKAKEEKALLEKNRALGEKLKNTKIELQVKAKNGKLFGSISVKDIAKELQNYHFDIPEKCIKIEQVIKKIGEYKVLIDLGNNISSQIILQVVELR